MRGGGRRLSVTELAIQREPLLNSGFEANYEEEEVCSACMYNMCTSMVYLRAVRFVEIWENACVGGSIWVN